MHSGPYRTRDIVDTAGQRIAELPARLAAAARALQTEPDTQRTMERSVRVVNDLVGPCHYVGISVVHRDRTVTTAAATDPLVVIGDELQYALGEGPVLDAIWHREAVISPDLARDERWPVWAPRVAAELKVASLLSLQLFTSTSVVGGLNLYSTRTDAFDHDDIDTATVIAAQVAVAVAVAQHADQLRVRADSRAIIGQAQGMLMERYQLDNEQAFHALRRFSQETNTKLVQVAEGIIRTRQTPST